MRHWWCLVIVLTAAAPAAAQDMPLSQILIEGEGWRAVEKSAAPKFPSSAETSAKDVRYSVDPARGEVRQQRVTSTGASVTAATQYLGLGRPSCVVLWPDGGHLVVGDAGDKYLWAFRVENDGRIGPGDRYYSLRVRAGQTASGVTAMTFDSAGRLYACTELGVQVFDPTGRLSGGPLKPAEASLTGIAFGGPDNDQLFVVCGDKVYARKLKSMGTAPKPAK